ncbi:response regulator [Polaribacter litorisediminis]|uniref:response regulator n=1 Tax=Polaribacter litorisediminis TaxID=1908341 RepID=UPI001CC08363|nr:response regulator [Polaribacter litorisediminis]UAM97458.1 response regulator [Polaribacter litorisediminis]
MLTNKKNILIVEDEILIAQLLKKSILNHGYNCAGIAINYNAAELLLKTTKVDLVLIDIRISGNKTGLDVAHFINENFGIPFLFISSFNDKETLQNIKALSPKGYINKPINNATLLTTIDIVFDNINDKNKVYTSINVGRTTYNIHLSELLYVEAEHVYVRLLYKSKSTLIRSSLKAFLDQMPSKSLFQISRSIAVNPTFVERVDAVSVTIADQKFKLSKNYKNNLLRYF